MVNEILEEFVQSLVGVDHGFECGSRLSRARRPRCRRRRPIRVEYAVVLFAHGRRNGHLKRLLIGVWQEPSLTTEVGLLERGEKSINEMRKNARTTLLT